MLVAELIARLQALPQDAKVVVRDEGGDLNTSQGVEAINDGPLCSVKEGWYDLDRPFEDRGPYLDKAVMLY